MRPLQRNPDAYLSVVPYISQRDETAIEWHMIARRLEALYRAQRGGDDSVYTRQRIGRLEGLQKALMGSPEALSEVTA